MGFWPNCLTGAAFRRRFLLIRRDFALVSLNDYFAVFNIEISRRRRWLRC